MSVANLAQAPYPKRIVSLAAEGATWRHAPTSPHTDGGSRVDQPVSTPKSEILLLTHADTDLLALHHALADLPPDFPAVGAHSLGQIKSAEHMTALLEECGDARVIVVRLLGGLEGVPGLRDLVARAHAAGQHLILVSGTGALDPEPARADLERVLGFVCDRLVPVLRRTEDEIHNLLAALEGRHVPPGPSGAPTRGNAHVLPTGRNFYWRRRRGWRSEGRQMSGYEGLFIQEVHTLWIPVPGVGHNPGFVG